MNRSWIALLALAAACGSEAEFEITEVSAPLARRVQVTFDEPTALRIAYRAGDESFVVRSEEAIMHEPVLARLLPSMRYDVQVTNDANGEVLFDGDFETAPLPPKLAELELTAEGSPTHPLTVLEVRTGTVSGVDFAGLVIVDERGRIVWFWEGAGPQGFARRENGDFAVNDSDIGIVNVAPDGTDVIMIAQREVPDAFHHDIIAAPGDKLRIVARDARMYANELWSAEAIWEHDPATGSTEKLWSAWDFYDPAVHIAERSRPDDWLHANAISFGPRGNMLMSLHFVDQIVSIAPDMQSLEWRLGGPESDFDLPDELVFSGQHTAVEIEPNHVLMFDNGFARTGTAARSRALELELDPGAGTVTKAFEFFAPNDNFSQVISSARRLDNGNTFMCFGSGPGLRRSTGPIEVYEVDPALNVEWHLVVGGPRTVYRGTAIDSIAGETRSD